MSKTSQPIPPDDEQMSFALRYAQSLGKPSSLFSAGVRTIRNAPSILRTDDIEKLKRFAFDTLHLVIKVSPTLKATLFHAAEELEPDALDEALPLNVQRLISLFNPDELCAILALTYYYRRIKKLCAAEEFERVLLKLSLQLEFGAMLGDVLPEVGRGSAMFACGIRVLAQALLMTQSIKPYRELRRKLDQKGMLFDSEREIEAFCCSHLQIASHLVSEMGYGVGPRTAFGIDLSAPHFKEIGNATSKYEADIVGWRHVLLNAENLHCEGKVHRDSQNIFTTDEIRSLEERSSLILTKGVGYRWLTGPVDSVPEDVANNLGISSQLSSSASEDSQAS